MQPPKIVISGYSCRLPESNSAGEFWRNLINHTDMVTVDDRRWPSGYLDTPPRFGKLKDLDRFDAQFFEVHPKQAQKMDPQLRLLLEVSYEALQCAGINPMELRGTNTGVFVGASFSDADAIFGAKPDQITGYENTGCATSMFANRLSYYYDFHGPSENIDTACSSSLVALHAAMNALANHECDYALVAGSNVILRPGTTAGFKKLKMVASDGTSRAFDKKGKGFARAEGVVVIVLTRASLANRIIATVLGSATNNDGYTSQGITFPNGDAQYDLLRSLYAKKRINPNHVTYIEAHGTGTQAGDPQEANALCDFFCGNRRLDELPLLIGSVKSNMGHAEPAAGLSGLAKVLLAMEHKMLPANLHYITPNPGIPGLVDGRLSVVDSNTEWTGGIVGINSFGFGGSNAHVILQDEIYTNESNQENRPPLPIAPVAARTESGLEKLCNYVSSNNLTLDESRLLQLLSAAPNKTHPYRGGVVRLSNGSTKTVKNCNVRKKPPVWFVFPGMGAQWEKMGSALMCFETFDNSINRCALALKDTEIDLLEIIAAASDRSELDVTQIFVALTAIQIALVDLLNSLGINPDGMIGHSVGEIACGYADGGLSVEQAVLAAYWRGKCVLDAQVQGKMAVVPMEWRKAQQLCGDGVVAACHNSAESVTLSGDAAAIEAIVENLINQDIDARLVNSSGIAFHSADMVKVAPSLQEKLAELIPFPKPRSNRWISTSQAESEWNTSNQCSADYFVKNLVNPVRFYEALNCVPDNSIVIEVGAHTLLRMAISDTLKTCQHTGLMYKGRNNSDDLMEGLAKCYIHGLDLNWRHFYPHDDPINSPCHIPGLTSWDHSQSWQVPSYKDYIANTSSSSQNTFHIDINDENFQYLRDHKINNKILFPAVGYLYLVWKTIAQARNTPIERLPIQFENVVIDRATTLFESHPVDLEVRYMLATHVFEIVNGAELVAHGNVKAGMDYALVDTEINNLEIQDKQTVVLSTPEIYKEFRLRGYQYGPKFQSLEKLSIDGNYAEIHWQGNWVAFLDAVLQSSLIKVDRQTVVPTKFRRFNIDPMRQPHDQTIKLYISRYLQCFSTDAVVIEGLACTPIARSKQRETPSVSSYEFIANHEFHQCDEYSEKYANVLESYIVVNALSVIENMQTHGADIPEHILSLKSLLSQSVTQSPSNININAYVNNSRAIHLRLAKHIFEKPESLFENALAHIVGYSEYNQLYKSDIGFTALYGDRYLGSLVDLVVENIGITNPIRICEVGAGTGGISSHILPRLINNKSKYIVTDVTSGFFEKLRKDLANYSTVTDFQTWNINDSMPASLEGGVDLVVASNVIHAVPNLRVTLCHIYNSLNEGGFFLLHEATHGQLAILGTWGFIDQLWQFNDPQDRSLGALLTKSKWESLLDDCGFDVVACKQDSISSSLFLCRKRRTAEGDQQTYIMSNDFSKDLVGLQSIMPGVQNQPQDRVWLQAYKHTASGLIGMVNCLLKEPGGEQVRSIYLDDVETISDELLSNQQQFDLAINVYKNAKWGTYRHIVLSTEPLITDNAYLDINNKGDLDTLTWVQSPDLRKHKFDFEPHYFGLNFKAIMLATGKLVDNTNIGDKLFTGIGGEFSGIARDGSRVMGYLPESFSSKLASDHDMLPCLFKVPEHWSLQQAATVPIVYMTAYLGLILRAKLQPGERILIHAGTGGVGQAAINIALAMNCEIFTTVGTDEKRAFIKQMFPDIADDHIGNSRDTSFEAMVLDKTQGKGVNVVLNSLSDEKLHASLRVLATQGRFVEIGRYDMIKDTAIGMSVFSREISFYGIYLENVFLAANDERDTLIDHMTNGINSGVVKPLTSTVFKHDEVVDAFRYMSRGKHIGKVLICLRDKSDADLLELVAQRKTWFDLGKSYLITGGLGGVGLELADWLVQRGARHLVLTSRKGLSNAYQQFRLRMWREKGVAVTISQKNVANATDAKSLILEMESNNPIGGIFHLAMVLDDALLENQTIDRFHNVYDIKVKGGENLDRLSRKNCKSLQHFVVFSSIASGLGNAGQSNYGLANSALERLCESRKQDGYPALAIQWGMIGDVGFVASNKERVRVGEIPIVEQSIHSCLTTLDQVMTQEKPVVSSAVFDVNLQAEEECLDNNSSPEKSLDSLFNTIKNILGIPSQQNLDQELTLSELGMDSLMAVEVEHVLKSEYDFDISLSKVRALTFAKIAEFFNISYAIENTSNDSLHGNEVAEGEVNGYSTVIYPYLTTPNATENTYFVNGFMVDSMSALSGIKFPKSTNVYIVQYEKTESVNELTDKWLAHIQKLSCEKNKIRVIGFSLGATIAQRVYKLIQLKDETLVLDIVTISPPKLEMFKFLDQFSLDELNAMSDDESINNIRKLPFYGDFPLLDIRDIMNQVRFMKHDRFYNKSLARSKLTVIPEQDLFCSAEDDVDQMSDRVVVTEGDHNIKSIDLERVLEML